MSLLANHALIRFIAPRIVESVKTSIAAGGNSGIITFSRAAKLGELILIFSGTNTSVSTTTPTGFTLIQTLGGVQKNYSFYKVAGASEATTYTVSFSSTVDTKTLIGVIVANINGTNPIGTSHSLTSGVVTTPRSLITTPFSESRLRMTVVHTKLAGNFRSDSAVNNDFTLLQEVTNSTTTQSFLVYKTLKTDDSGLTTEWSWTGGSTGFTANWMTINPRTTN